MIVTSGRQMDVLGEQRLEGPSSTDTNNNRNTNTGEKYGLRPRTIIKRLQQERVRQEAPKRSVRPKSRPAPLSKYRRKTANARERHRMKEINNAFDSLRKALPDVLEVQAASSAMTKITTLRLAVSYIRALSHVLEDDTDADICSLQNSLSFSFQNSLQQSLPPSFHKATPSPENPVTTFQYKNSTPPFSQHYLPNVSQVIGYYSTPGQILQSNTPSTVRGSLSSASDLEDLLSDDSCLLEDNLDVFRDIPTLSIVDPFDILLGAEKEAIAFTTELCNQ
ncbi:uncharacterized protein [Panulirus ornatus]|uniref:uncharacterized protein n=1 Tax=Panulirus ornatus TaxID=150431 RepID=UPI003A86AA40